MTVKKVYASKISPTTQAYKNFLTSVKKKNLKITTAKTGVKIYTKASNISLKFIAPVKSYAKADLNNWSGVLLLKHGKKSFLFTADAEEEAESDMLAKGLISKIDVLKVTHHDVKETKKLKQKIDDLMGELFED